MKKNTNQFNILVSILTVGIIPTVFFGLTASVLASNVYGNLDTAVGGTSLATSASGGNILPIISYLLTLVLGFLGVALVIMIIWAGIMWMMAGGEKGNVDKAKAMIKNAVIGLLIVLSSYAITTFVITSFENISNKNKTSQIQGSNPAE